MHNLWDTDIHSVLFQIELNVPFICGHSWLFDIYCTRQNKFRTLQIRTSQHHLVGNESESTSNWRSHPFHPTVSTNAQTLPRREHLDTMPQESHAVPPSFRPSVTMKNHLEHRCVGESFDGRLLELIGGRTSCARIPSEANGLTDKLYCILFELRFALRYRFKGMKDQQSPGLGILLIHVLTPWILGCV